MHKFYSNTYIFNKLASVEPFTSYPSQSRGSYNWNFGSLPEDVSQEDIRRMIDTRPVSERNWLERMFGQNQDIHSPTARVPYNGSLTDNEQNLLLAQFLHHIYNVYGTLGKFNLGFEPGDTDYSKRQQNFTKANNNISRWLSENKDRLSQYPKLKDYIIKQYNAYTKQLDTIDKDRLGYVNPNWISDDVHETLTSQSIPEAIQKSRESDENQAKKELLDSSNAEERQAILAKHKYNQYIDNIHDYQNKINRLRLDPNLANNTNFVQDLTKLSKDINIFLSSSEYLPKLSLEEQEKILKNQKHINDLTKNIDPELYEELNNNTNIAIESLVNDYTKLIDSDRNETNLFNKIKNRDRIIAYSEAIKNLTNEGSSYRNRTDPNTTYYQNPLQQSNFKDNYNLGGTGRVMNDGSAKMVISYKDPNSQKITGVPINLSREEYNIFKDLNPYQKNAYLASVLNNQGVDKSVTDSLRNYNRMLSRSDTFAINGEYLGKGEEGLNKNFGGRVILRQGVNPTNINNANITNRAGMNIVDLSSNNIQPLTNVPPNNVNNVNGIDNNVNVTDNKVNVTGIDDKLKAQQPTNP